MEVSEHAMEPVDPAVASVVREGLSRPQKQLPAWMLYDTEGSRLFEEITRVPEYYPTRVERELFTRQADTLVTRASDGVPTTWVELGAGTAIKTQVLLSAAVAHQPEGCLYVPVDVSPSPLHEARERLSRELPEVEVRPVIGDNREAARMLGALPGRRVLLFIGSSIGNYEEPEAVELLALMRANLRPGDALLLSTDLTKPLEVLLPAYDDAAGVTAAFNLNVLHRMNRDLGADFDIGAFAHRARWNAPRSRIEMHLESLVPQDVRIGALGLEVHFDAQETLHTESSHKYDRARVEALLEQSGFRLESHVVDPRGWFAVNLARV